MQRCDPFFTFCIFQIDPKGMIQLRDERGRRPGLVALSVQKCDEWERRHQDYRRMMKWMSPEQRRQSLYWNLRYEWVNQKIDDVLEEMEECEDFDGKAFLEQTKLERYKQAIQITFDNGLTIIDARKDDHRCAWGFELHGLLVELKTNFGRLFFKHYTAGDDLESDEFYLTSGFKKVSFSIKPIDFISHKPWRHVHVSEYFHDFEP